MIWDEGLRTALHSVQRVLVLKLISKIGYKNRDRLVFSEPLLVVRYWWLVSVYKQIRAQSRLE